MALRAYLTYGLVVHSEIPLWGETDADRSPDVTILCERGPIEPPDESANADPRTEIRLFWPDVCDMSIRAGSEIAVRAPAGAEVSHLRHLVNGIGLGLALHQRGVFTLHASAVALEGGAVALMGAKGAGKSTLAAALARRGHTLLSDDVVAIDLPAAGLPQVRPGPTNLNLWPDSAAATGHDPASLSTIWSHSTKLVGWVEGRTLSEPVPLRALVILERADAEAGLEGIGSLPAFTQLVAHSHAFRWVEDAPSRPRHLGQCRAVLERVPVFRLRRGPSLENLPALVRRVEAHFGVRAAAGAESVS